MRDVLTAWCDDAADGPANMAADECLATEAERRDAVLVRFYRWSSTTLSLGGFQRHADVGTALAGLPVVRRPSGGGAILHGSDLTYAAAVPRRHRWGASPAALYDAFHATLADWLRGQGIAAALHDDDAERSPAGEPPFLCFDRRAPGDLIVPGPGAASGNAKVMGSAQRRLGGVVLQHGSLLVRTNDALPAAARHAGLGELAPAFAAVEIEAVVTGWLTRLATALDADLVRGSEPFTAGRAAEIDARAGRFRDRRWTERR